MHARTLAELAVGARAHSRNWPSVSAAPPAPPELRTCGVGTMDMGTTRLWLAPAAISMSLAENMRAEERREGSKEEAIVALKCD